MKINCNLNIFLNIFKNYMIYIKCFSVSWFQRKHFPDLSIIIFVLENLGTEYLNCTHQFPLVHYQQILHFRIPLNSLELSNSKIAPANSFSPPQQLSTIDGVALCITSWTSPRKMLCNCVYDTCAMQHAACNVQRH